MITIYKDWAVKADQYCYSVGRMRESEKDGKVTITLINPKYVDTLSQAVQVVLKQEQRQLANDVDMTLIEAVQAFDRLQQELLRSLEVISEKEVLPDA